jgi:Domain of unknown function (DUF1989)
VHDSFNLFTCTEVTLDGHATMTRQNTKAGDHVDLLALRDVLAVPNVCGADVMRTSNFSLKPIKLRVFASNQADITAVPEVPTLRSQRTPNQFRNPTIKADRPQPTEIRSESIALSKQCCPIGFGSDSTNLGVGFGGLAVGKTIGPLNGRHCGNRSLDGDVRFSRAFGARPWQAPDWHNCTATLRAGHNYRRGRSS